MADRLDVGFRAKPAGRTKGALGAEAPGAPVGNVEKGKI